jgi:hypothetical protein
VSISARKFTEMNNEKGGGGRKVGKSCTIQLGDINVEQRLIRRNGK